MFEAIIFWSIAFVASPFCMHSISFSSRYFPMSFVIFSIHGLFRSVFQVPMDCLCIFVLLTSNLILPVWSKLQYLDPFNFTNNAWYALKRCLFYHCFMCFIYIRLLIKWLKFSVFLSTFSISYWSTEMCNRKCNFFLSILSGFVSYILWFYCSVHV